MWSRDKYQSHFYIILKSLPTACTHRHNSSHPLESAYESNFTLKLKTNTDSVERHAISHRSSGGGELHCAAHDLRVRISKPRMHNMPPQTEPQLNSAWVRPQTHSELSCRSVWNGMLCILGFVVSREGRKLHCVRPPSTRSVGNGMSLHRVGVCLKLKCEIRFICRFKRVGAIVSKCACRWQWL